MLDSLRLRILEPLTVGGYLALLLTGIWFRTRDGWTAILTGVAILAAAAWLMSYRRGHAITDTPTSRIGSAAQGYVELVGRGIHHPGGPILTPTTGLPCLWYRFIIEQSVGDNQWKRVSSGRSDQSFLLDDGSGKCLIDPEYAEVIARRKEQWVRGNMRYTEWLLLPQAKVYVLGQLSTIGGTNSDLDLREDISGLLADWKRDKEQLLTRFDLDGNGEIDEQEWLLARRQARREVEKTHREIRLQSGTNIVHKPRDGRLFLISDLDPMQLATRYQRWTWFHLAMLFAALGCIIWLPTAL